MESEQLRLDLTAASTPEPNGQRTSALRRMTLMPSEAAAMLGVSRDFFDEHIKPELRIIRREDDPDPACRARALGRRECGPLLRLTP